METFYDHLGARPLSALVKTEYIPHGTLSSLSDHAKALRRHVLERLTIFLAEARRKQSEYTPDWLNKEGSFSVVEVRDLKSRYTYRNGKTEHHHLEVGIW